MQIRKIPLTDKKSGGDQFCSGSEMEFWMFLIGPGIFLLFLIPNCYCNRPRRRQGNIRAINSQAQPAYPTVGTAIQMDQLTELTERRSVMNLFPSQATSSSPPSYDQVGFYKTVKPLPQHFQANHHLHHMAAWKTLDINHTQYTIFV